jgi:hypothetical protein
MYEYTTLIEPHSFRVLELQPTRKRTADLTIRLLEVSINMPPNFEALSYAWESQSLDQSISCDREALLISATCKAALLRLRRKTRSRLLWIDQICINQTCVKEKNHQVAIMGEIYSKAKITIVWLGVNPRGDELLRHLQESGFLEFCRWLSFRYRPRYHSSSTMRAERSPKPVPVFHILKSIMWFNRMWTIQEVALARQVKVLSPVREMDYDRFMNKWMERYGGFSELKDRNPIVDVIEARASGRQMVKSEGSEKWKVPWWEAEWAPHDPMQFLCLVTASAASHPSDKIFAIHGVMKELGVLLPEPDYSMDTGEVYWKACAVLMTMTCSLQPLHLVNGLHWNSDYPSWVPDFSQTHRRISGYTASLRTFRGWYSGHGGPAKFMLIDNHRVIATKAKVIGPIHGRIYQQTELQSNHLGDDSLDGAGLVREYIHVIHCLQSWMLASETLEDFDALFELIFYGYGYQVSRHRGIQPQLRLLLWISAYDPGAIYSKFYKSIEDSLTVQKFLSTPDFANLLYLPEAQLLAVIIYSGLMAEFERIIAPHAAAVGDMVALIPGTSALMILHPTQPNTYQVIGHACVVGMMAGQMWKTREDGDLEKELEDNNVYNIFLI